MKKGILILARILVAIAAMYLASRKINWQELNQFEWSSSLLWLLPALLAYNISQFISAYRLLRFYKVYIPGITYPFNLRLYYKGMFFNLFLPGGIGGDAYKIVALKNTANTYTQLATATLLDRFTGLAVLLLIVSVLTRIVPLQGLFHDFLLLLPIFVIVGIPCYWIFVYYFFKPFSKVLTFAGLLSVLVQGFQLLSFYCILYALHINLDSPAEHALLFFVSSIISALPFSIGGIGTRELAMATGAAYFNFSATKMVSASLVFFILTALSALVGWGINSRRKDDNVNTKNE